MHVFLIALGANLPLGDQTPSTTLQLALNTLEEAGLQVKSVSKFYQTPCFPMGAGPDYVNAAACLRSTKNPYQVLEILHETEACFGRERTSRWGMRTLDLDLIAADDMVLPSRDVFDRWQSLPTEAQIRVTPDDLILPHPRVQDRAFVLVPLCDVASNWHHPVLKRSVAQMRDALPAEDVASVVPIVAAY